MVFVVCGLNHKTAPISVREQFALSSATNDARFRRFMEQFPNSEVVFLSTCNRTEIYYDTDDVDQLRAWLAEAYQCSPQAFSSYSYQYEGEAAVEHLLRVGSGLDSMMLGEPQILGQLKQAYQQALDAGTVKQQLQHVFQFVFGACKRIRTQSGIGKNPISVAYAAVQQIREQFEVLHSLTVLIIGSGDTSSLVAKYLHQRGVTRFMIANRTKENAALLAKQFDGEALSITDIPVVMHQADVIVSATACPFPFITKTLVEHALTQRGQERMVLLDLAMPRDIETAVGELPSVRLYNIDDLQKMVGEGMEERRAAALLAEDFVNEALTRFVVSQRSMQANGVITDYRDRMKVLAAQELQRAQQKLSAGACQFTVLEEFSERLLNKLVHSPTIGLKHAASDGRHEVMELVQYLFNQPVDNLVS